jgi:hypothetical protein
MKKLIVLLLVGSFATSCYNDKEEVLYPKTIASEDCNITVEVSYAAEVQPIIKKACYNCHKNSTANSLGAGIRFEALADLRNSINNDKFIESIKHESGVSKMPKSAPKMSACDILKIETWSKAGQKDN